MNEDILFPKMETHLTRSEQIYESSQLNQWIFDTIRPWLKGKVLELGSGSGYIADCFVNAGMALAVSDPSKRFSQFLKDKFKNQPLIKYAGRIDWTRIDFESIYKKVLNKVSTVLILNTLEHSARDKKLMLNAKKLLSDGGHLIALFPARTALYDDSNFAFEGWRSQSKRDIRDLFGKDLNIRKIKFFNLVSNSSQYLSRESLDSETPEKEKSINLYRRKVKVFRVNDEILFHRTGLSMLVIFERSKVEKISN